MCINKNSSNINEVIETILDFFIQKFHKHKKHETLTSNKNTLKKHLRGKSQLFSYLRFVLLPGCLCAFWCFWCFWYMQNLFAKKIKDFKPP